MEPDSCVGSDENVPIHTVAMKPKTFTFGPGCGVVDFSDTT
jgi:hypothetical protein